MPRSPLFCPLVGNWWYWMEVFSSLKTKFPCLRMIVHFAYFFLRLQGFLNDSTILFCGGRESLLVINSDCWRYDLDLGGLSGLDGLEKTGSSDVPAHRKWVSTASLPRAIAGATSIAVGSKLYVFGGVVEEDFYADTNTSDYYYYYDYFTEETGNGMNEW